MVPQLTIEGRRPRGTESGVVRAVGFWSTGLTSLLASLFCMAVFYQPLVAAAQPLHVLSTTIVIHVFLLLWATIWLALEVVWDWGRNSNASA